MELEEMSDEVRESFNTMERIDLFALANPQLAVELPYLDELFTENRDFMAQLRAVVVNKTSSQSAGISGTRMKTTVLRETVSDLRRVGSTARTIAKKVPTFENKFIVSRGNITYQDAVQLSEAFLRDRLEAKTEFAKRGLGDTFFANLQANLDELRGKSGEQLDAKRTTVGANAEAEDIIEKWLLTREELNTALENLLSGDADKLAEWRSAKRIERRRIKKAKDPNTPPED